MQSKNRKNRRGGRLTRKNNNNKYHNEDPISVPKGKLVIYRDIGRFTPDRIRTTLRYRDTTYSRGTTSNNAMNFNYRSSVFDPDSALGSGAISGFLELANLYISYRVLTMKLRCRMVNEEVTGVTLAIWPSNVLLNINSLAASDISEYASNPHSKQTISGSVNSPPVVLTSKISGVEMFGTQFLTDGAYASGTGGNPATMYGFNIGAATTLGSNFTTHMSFQNTIEYFVEFFELRQLES
jgi:hypothetical protein